MNPGNADRFTLAGLHLGVAALGLTLAGSAGAWNLDHARIESSSGQITLTVQGEGAGETIPCDVFCLDQPHRVVLDLFGAEAPLPIEGEAEVSGLTSARTSLWKDDPAGKVVRYVLETASPMDYRTEARDGTLSLILTPAGSEATPLDLPEASTAAAEIEVAAEAPELQPEDAAPSMGSADPAFVPPPPLAPSVAWGAAPVALAQTGTKPMNLDVQEADLRTVFRSIAEFGGTNVVPDRDVQGPISIRLVDTPWRQALDVVCRAANLVALDGDGFIRVATLRSFREESLDHEAAERKREELMPVGTQVFSARYASASELKVAVFPALSSRGLVEVDERTNSIIVRDIQTKLDDVAALVKALDAETKQVEIVAQLIDVDATASRKLGVDWVLRNLHSTSERISGELGVGESLVDSPSGQIKVGVVRGFGDLEATIEALERDNRANIISNPKITTTNNRKAKILVGKEIPLITLDERGNPVPELKKVGITLEVTPYINSDNKITMDLHPEVSDLSSQATVTGGLIFTTSQADTRVMVGSGDTAVIGGLIRTNETRFAQGVPILRSLPFVGGLFRSSDTRKEKRELIIMVTPTIVEPMASR